MDLFWSKVEKSSDCWEWRASRKSPGGYGQFLYRGKNTGAHRVAWEITYGPIPPGMYILHKCDNPGCVNPEHLICGTSKDNALDAVSKERAAGQKLSIAEVLKIRELYSTKQFSYAELAKLFCVEKSTVGLICRRKTFANV